MQIRTAAAGYWFNDCVVTEIRICEGIIWVHGYCPGFWFGSGDLLLDRFAFAVNGLTGGGGSMERNTEAPQLR